MRQLVFDKIGKDGQLQEWQEDWDDEAQDDNFVEQLRTELSTAKVAPPRRWCGFGMQVVHVHTTQARWSRMEDRPDPMAAGTSLSSWSNETYA